MPRWMKRLRQPTSELGELDPFLLSLVASLAAASREGKFDDDDWVRITKVIALSQQIADASVAALRGGWDVRAAHRTLVDRREGPDGVEVRLTPKGRDLTAPIY